MSDELIGKTVGDYEVVQIIGSGGMGVVYKAREIHLQRDVAMKVLARHLSSNEEFIMRFRREAQLLAKLNHPNVVAIHKIGVEENLHYIAMEYVEGQTLSDIIKIRGKLDVHFALQVIHQVVAAVSAAHDIGIIHRDLKPQNLLVNSRGLAKVLDFGIAKLTDVGATALTMTGAFLGTPQYMSPEQCNGKPADHRSDIYALGVVLYHSLAGRPPFQSDTPLMLMRKIAEEETPSLTDFNELVDERVIAIVERALAKSPDDRYQSGHEMEQDIYQILLEDGITPVVRTTSDTGYVVPTGKALKNLAEMPTMGMGPRADDEAIGDGDDVTEQFKTVRVGGGEPEKTVLDQPVATSEVADSVPPLQLERGGTAPPSTTAPPAGTVPPDSGAGMGIQDSEKPSAWKNPRTRIGLASAALVLLIFSWLVFGLRGPGDSDDVAGGSEGIENPSDKKVPEVPDTNDRQVASNLADATRNSLTTPDPPKQPDRSTVLPLITPAPKPTDTPTPTPTPKPTARSTPREIIPSLMWLEAPEEGGEVREQKVALQWGIENDGKAKQYLLRVNRNERKVSEPQATIELKRRGWYDIKIIALTPSDAKSPPIERSFRYTPNRAPKIIQTRLERTTIQKGEKGSLIAYAMDPDEDDVTLYARIDQGDWQEISDGGWELPGLSIGKHKVEARAVDALGRESTIWSDSIRTKATPTPTPTPRPTRTPTPTPTATPKPTPTPIVTPIPTRRAQVAPVATPRKRRGDPIDEIEAKAFVGRMEYALLNLSRKRGRLNFSTYTALMHSSISVNSHILTTYSDPKAGILSGENKFHKVEYVEALGGQAEYKILLYIEVPGDFVSAEAYRLFLVRKSNGEIAILGDEKMK